MFSMLLAGGCCSFVPGPHLSGSALDLHRQIFSIPRRVRWCLGMLSVCRFRSWTARGGWGKRRCGVGEVGLNAVVVGFLVGQERGGRVGRRKVSTTS
ncbi:hypothetical protein BJ508DRAFT_172937 [Ascobolus immersus RN42]|uniref:Uncharacterized protein n=1 Tax=Ascobolus immersus RN42 TaxID=1160509 RepID=A0A3N4HTL9_ASCIM|nr:hypothetical protein BJ508DRAFT_172937 [Ascobolus immersus RN42]